MRNSDTIGFTFIDSDLPDFIIKSIHRYFISDQLTVTLSTCDYFYSSPNHRNMKLNLFAILLVALIGITSCSEEDEPVAKESPEQETETYMKASTGGIAWTAATVAAEKIGDDQEYEIRILGTDTNDNKVSIVFTHGINQPGEYEYRLQAAADDHAYSAFSSNDFGKTYGSYSGTLNIEEYNLEQGVVKGSFEFVGWSSSREEIAITQGEFQAVY